MDLQVISDLLITPLKSLFSGSDTLAQHGAAHCYYFLVRGCYEQNYTELFSFLYKSFPFDVYLENEEFIDWISYLIQNGGIKKAAKNVVGIIDK